jgi:hypothetical protein
MISINGKTYTGNNITIKNGNVIIDGKNVESKDNSDEKIVIQLEGNFNNFKCDESIIVKGNIKADNIEVSNNIQCDDVVGDINAGKNVQCDDVAGDINAGNNVTCDDVVGNVTCGNNIN